LDEGIADDERAPAALLDRLAFHLDLTDIRLRDADEVPLEAADLAAARSLLPGVEVGSSLIETLCATAQALGIDSARATLLAVHAARCAAALDNRKAANEGDAVLAGRLVLAPRATRLPPPAEEPPAQEPESEPPPEPPAPENPAEPPPEDDEQEPPPPDERMLEDLLLAAATAAMPRGLLAQLKSAENRARRSHGTGRVGALQKKAKRGRPAGVRAGDTRRGDRLNIIETLRAAAPWQRLRQRESAGKVRRTRVDVRSQDFRVTHYKQKSETATIFVVDASGSSALNRLAEAKGAVELLLADCYVRRDRVALISFRGRSAELLLPPTRSLVRAKRSLGGLPGGGGTPLAAGIDAAANLADAVRRHGETPSIVFLTDGKANIGRAGAPGREAAEADAISAARSLRAAGVATLLVDTSPRTQPQAQNLAREMNAMYLALPYADARGLSAAVRAALSPTPA
jgi:magnesium chelatase subunit D